MDMKKSNFCNVILETNSKKFLLDSKDSNNNLSLSYNLKIIIFFKNVYRNIWNSWANRLAEIFRLLSDDDDDKDRK
jgi:hypothetical protein